MALGCAHRHSSTDCGVDIRLDRLIISDTPSSSIRSSNSSSSSSVTTWSAVQGRTTVQPQKQKQSVGAAGDGKLEPTQQAKSVAPDPNKGKDAVGGDECKNEICAITQGLDPIESARLSLRLSSERREQAQKLRRQSQPSPVKFDPVSSRGADATL